MKMKVRNSCTACSPPVERTVETTLLAITCYRSSLTGCNNTMLLLLGSLWNGHWCFLKQTENAGWCMNACLVAPTPRTGEKSDHYHTFYQRCIDSLQHRCQSINNFAVITFHLKGLTMPLKCVCLVRCVCR